MTKKKQVEEVKLEVDIDIFFDNLVETGEIIDFLFLEVKKFV